MIEEVTHCVDEVDTDSVKIEGEGLVLVLEDVLIVTVREFLGVPLTEFVHMEEADTDDDIEKFADTEIKPEAVDILIILGVDIKDREGTRLVDGLLEGEPVDVLDTSTLFDD